MLVYDGAKFTPPAPVAQVIVRSPKTDDSVANVPMLIDTGADVTLLPREPIPELLTSADSGDEYELEGFDGTRSLAPSVLLELRFLGRTFRGQLLVVDGSHGVLGRNVLNWIALALDGPNQTWGELNLGRTRSDSQPAIVAIPSPIHQPSHTAAPLESSPYLSVRSTSAPTARTIARMPALTSSGRSGHAWTTATNSGHSLPNSATQRATLAT